MTGSASFVEPAKALANYLGEELEVIYMERLPVPESLNGYAAGYLCEAHRHLIREFSSRPLTLPCWNWPALWTNSSRRRKQGTSLLSPCRMHLFSSVHQ